MKKLLTILFCLPLLIMAQAPQGFTYQGVATDNNGFELQNQSISIQASILSSSATGTTVWQETHTTTTDTFGLFNVTIGEGTSTNGGSSATFQEIDWGAASHFMKVEIDVNGGSNYVHVGTSQMMSVPYALYAENVHNLNMDSILGAVYDSISSSGIDSSEIANMIENAINGYPNDNQNNISDNSIINGYRLFYNRNNRYIFETDSAQVIENQLYDSHVAGYSVEISKLYIDELNQELYFLESHNTSAKGTMVKKTSLSNFDPQTIFIIPGSLSQITDFKVNPLSGEFYWSKCSGSDWGIYNYNDTTGTISYLVNSCVNAFCFNQSGDLFYSGGNLILDDQGSTVFTCPSNIDILEYDNSTFFMIAGNDYVYATSGGTTYDVLYTSPSSTITAMALSNTTQEVIFSYGGVIALADYNATYSQVTSLVQAQSLAVYGPGNINASPLNPIVSYIPNQSYYDLKSIYMIFKNDSIHAGVGSVNSEMLYNTQPFGYIKHLLLDQVNQELYFLQSNNQSAPGTMVMKTSLSNFNPQMMFIIPIQFGDISDFRMNPSSGLLYWSTDVGSQGIYNYNNGTINHLVNNTSVKGFCFNLAGDLFYSSGSDILDYQGTIVFTSTSGQINLLEYSSVSNTFFFLAGNDYIFNSGVGSGPIYDSGGSSIEVISLNETTQEVIFGVSGLTGIVDYSGASSYLINVHGNNSTSIEAID